MADVAALTGAGIFLACPADAGAPHMGRRHFAASRKPRRGSRLADRPPQVQGGASVPIPESGRTEPVSRSCRQAATMW